MTAADDLIVVDTSVILKWFHSDNEPEVDEARALLAAHQRAQIVTILLDLSWYELGNVLSRSLRWEPADVADQLDDLETLCGPPITADLTWHHNAAHLAARHDLTFYDASFVAAAEALNAQLVSADRQLLQTHLAISAMAMADLL